MKKKALFIGGTGTISTAIVRALAEKPDWEIWLLNRGNRKLEFDGQVHSITVDIHDEEAVCRKLENRFFDVVGEFIGYRLVDVERDFRIFFGKTKQFIFISSASAYQKPCASPWITEGTALANPYWQYSRDKIACENFLMEKYRENGFPVTIVRPSHTYDERKIPVAVHGAQGSWQVIRRMMEHKPVIIPGDGSSLWTVTFNTDFARGYIGLMGNRNAIGEAFQITGDETLTWDQIYRTIADELGVELIPYHVASDYLAAVGTRYDLKGGLLGDKSVSVIFENTKLKKAVPVMETKVPFHEGVHRAMEYIMAHPECQKEDPEFDVWCDKVIESLEKAKEIFKTGE